MAISKLSSGRIREYKIGSEATNEVGRILQSIDNMLGRSELEVIGSDAFIDIELPSNK